LNHDKALDEARYMVDYGLLGGYGVSTDSLKAVGERLLVDAIEPFERG
jgi:hypothetical protein